MLMKQKRWVDNQGGVRDEVHFLNLSLTQELQPLKHPLEGRSNPWKVGATLGRQEQPLEGRSNPWKVGAILGRQGQPLEGRGNPWKTGATLGRQEQQEQPLEVGATFKLLTYLHSCFNEVQRLNKACCSHPGQAAKQKLDCNENSLDNQGCLRKSQIRMPLTLIERPV